MEAVNTVKETLNKGLEAIEGFYGDTKAKVDEFATENYPKLVEELAKYNVTLPALDEIKTQIESVEKKVEELTSEAKAKIEEALDKINGEEAKSTDAA